MISAVYGWQNQLNRIDDSDYAAAEETMRGGKD